MRGYKDPIESFQFINTLEHPLTAKTLATICEALTDKAMAIEQDWLVSVGQGNIKFDLCDYDYESEVKE